jgi:hypothetical protein
MLVQAFVNPEDGQSLIAISNRGLGALGLAGMRPINIRIRPPTPDELARLKEMSVLGDTLPSSRIAVTKNRFDSEILHVIDIP